MGAAVMLLAGHRACDSQVAGLSPERAPPCSGIRQPTYTCASVIKYYNAVLAKGQ